MTKQKAIPFLTHVRRIKKSEYCEELAQEVASKHDDFSALQRELVEGLETTIRELEDDPHLAIVDIGDCINEMRDKLTSFDVFLEDVLNSTRMFGCHLDLIEEQEEKEEQNSEECEHDINDDTGRCNRCELHVEDIDELDEVVVKHPWERISEQEELDNCLGVHADLDDDGFDKATEQQCIDEVKRQKQKIKDEQRKQAIVPMTWDEPWEDL